MRSVRWITPLLLVGLLAPAAPVAPRARPDIVVYLIDTLRPDHLGAYGYARETSPQIDAFRRDAVLFERAYAPSAWTKPSTASLLTGLEPARHGAQTRRRRLSDEHTLLSEYLKGLGYRTAGFVTNPHVVPYWGFAQGYDTYRDIGGRDWRRTSADVVNAEVFGQLERGLPRPFFLYLHTIEPHAPYDPKPEYRGRFSEHPAPVLDVAELGPSTPPSLLENARAMYDAEIYQNDVEFGRLLAELKRRELYEGSLIVLTSDHGEEHLEHGRGGHGQQLFEESVRVPLLVKLPHGERAGERVAAPVSLLDVVPTLLARLGVEPAAPLDGIDLGPLLAGATPDPERPLYFELEFERGVIRPEGSLYIVRALLQGGLKYIQETLPTARRLLFDLERDPGERNDLLASQPETARRLARALERHRLAADAGLHLKVAAPVDGARVVRGRLRTSGRFEALRGEELEEGDVVSLVESGRALELHFQLRSHPQEGEEGDGLQDVDALVVRVVPPEADVLVERLGAEGEAELPVFVGPLRQARRARPVVVNLADAALLAPETEELFAPESRARAPIPAGGYLLLVPDTLAPGGEVEGELPENLRQRLKALGYLDE